MTEIQTFMLSISFGFAIGHFAGDLISIVFMIIDAVKAKHRNRQ